MAAFPTLVRLLPLALATAGLAAACRGRPAERSAPVAAAASPSGSSPAPMRSAPAPLASTPCAILLDRHPPVDGSSRRHRLSRVCVEPSGSLSHHVIASLDTDSVPPILEVARIVRSGRLVLETGPIIDLLQGRVVSPWRKGLSFVGADDQQLVVRVWAPAPRWEAIDVWTGEATQLAATSPWRQIERVDASYRVIRSPDGQRLAYMDQSGSDFRLMVVEGDARPRELASGFNSALGPIASPYDIGPPYAWIDDGSLLTQRENGHLVAVSLLGEVRPVATIPVKTEGALQVALRRDDAGRLLYFANQVWIIDTKDNRARQATSRAAGHGFEIAPYDSTREATWTAMSDGRAIGTQTCSVAQMKATQGALAVECGGFAEARKLLVWSAKSGAWASVDPGPGVLLGWFDAPPSPAAGGGPGP